MHTLTFSDLEMELLSTAVRAHAEDLERYTAWIDDRPMLPAREQAVAMVKSDARQYRDLQIKIYNAVSGKPKL